MQLLTSVSGANVTSVAVISELAVTLTQHGNADLSLVVFWFWYTIKTRPGPDLAVLA
jgi:hypothetical protein